MKASVKSNSDNGQGSDPPRRAQHSHPRNDHVSHGGTTEEYLKNNLDVETECYPLRTPSAKLVFAQTLLEQLSCRRCGVSGMGLGRCQYILQSLLQQQLPEISYDWVCNWNVSCYCLEHPPLSQHCWHLSWLCGTSGISFCS